jgi:hypothetical protein
VRYISLYNFIRIRVLFCFVLVFLFLFLVCIAFQVLLLLFTIAYLIIRDIYCLLSSVLIYRYLQSVNKICS